MTWNLKDFPAPQIAPHGIAAVSPDAFLSALHRAYPKALLSSIARARENLRRTTPSVTEFVDALERHGLVAFTSILRRHAARLR